VRTHDFRYGRCLRPAGAAYFRDRAARGCRPLPVFSAVPVLPDQDRLPPDMLRLIRETLEKHGTKLAETPEADQKLAELRKLYEPYVYALAERFDQTLPPGFPRKIERKLADHAWAKTTNGTAAAALVHDDHF